MPSNYVGVDAFSTNLDLMTDADPPRAQLFRTPNERLLDNDTYLRARLDSAFLKQATALRAKTVTFTDTSAILAAVTVSYEEDDPGPVLAIKAGQAFAIYDHDSTEAYPGGAIPTLTSPIGAAEVATTRRIGIVGATSPFCAYLDPGGVWTAGGVGIGGTPATLAYSPTYGFFAGRSGSANVFRSPDIATAWTGAATGLAGVLRVAVIGGGSGAGRVVALSTAATPIFSRSTDNGASFALQAGTVASAGTADNSGTLAGCPMVARRGMNRFVYHVGRYDAGARLRLARSADGETWQAGPTIEAPPGRIFEGTPLIFACKTTGLLVVVAPAESLDAAGHDVKLVYASSDFTSWVGANVYPGVLGTTAFAVAGGRVLYTTGAGLSVSDGFSFKVFT
jgi:hypothetical protein